MLTIIRGVGAVLLVLGILAYVATGGEVERPAAVLASAAMALLCLGVLVAGLRSARTDRTQG